MSRRRVEPPTVPCSRCASGRAELYCDPENGPHPDDIPTGPPLCNDCLSEECARWELGAALALTFARIGAGFGDLPPATPHQEFAIYAHLAYEEASRDVERASAN